MDVRWLRRPTYYTRPFGFKTTLTLLPDSDVLEYVLHGEPEVQGLRTQIGVEIH
jgi:hypothetical protein